MPGGGFLNHRLLVVYRHDLKPFYNMFLRPSIRAFDITVQDGVIYSSTLWRISQMDTLLSIRYIFWSLVFFKCSISATLSKNHRNLKNESVS